MNARTITQAIVEVLRRKTEAQTPTEIYNDIIRGELYSFNSKTPIGIINSEIRKSCVGIELKKSKSDKLFEPRPGGKYSLVKK
jgi:hypothetical protein